jgi:hypothetical protein
MPPPFQEVVMEDTFVNRGGEVVKRRGRPPKEKKPAINETADAVIKVNLSMPGHEAIDFEMRIKNVKGSLLGTQRRPEVFMETIKEKLRF